MARKGETGGHVPSIEVMGSMVPLGPGRHARRHRGRLFLPVLRGGSYVTGQIIGVNGGMYI